MLNRNHVAGDDSINNQTKSLEVSVRHQADKLKYKLHKLRGAEKYMLIDENDAVILGHGYSCTLDEINRFVNIKVNDERMAFLNRVVEKVAKDCKNHDVCSPPPAVYRPSMYVKEEIAATKARRANTQGIKMPTINNRI